MPSKRLSSRTVGNKASSSTLVSRPLESVRANCCAFRRAVNPFFGLPIVIAAVYRECGGRQVGRRQTCSRTRGLTRARSCHGPALALQLRRKLLGGAHHVHGGLTLSMNRSRLGARCLPERSKRCDATRVGLGQKFA